MMSDPMSSSSSATVIQGVESSMTVEYADRILQAAPQKKDPFCATHATEFPCDLTIWNIAIVGAATSLFGLMMVIFLNRRIASMPRGNDLMNKISDQIKLGAEAFLKTEYKYLSGFVIIMALTIFTLYTINNPSDQRIDGLRYAFAFLTGAILSASTGWRGMAVATDTNVKTTEAAAKEGLAKALSVAFSGGAVMGFSVVSFGLAGLATVFCLAQLNAEKGDQVKSIIFAADVVAAFGFGASSIALFARVAGGIYTKAADVGADLVGKVEMSIPEDDPRNPAVIADNVGDNVGDVAGMGADLFESYVGAMVATVALSDGDMALAMLPFYVSGVGILASCVAFFAVGIKGDAATQSELMFAMHKGNLVASALTVAMSTGIIFALFQPRQNDGVLILCCIIIGLIAGASLGHITEYFTSYSHSPTQSIADAGLTGPASVIIQGLGIGMISSVFPVLVIATTILGCNTLYGQYGIAISSVGMLSTLGITLAADAFGPIADNAGGIAEMAGLGEPVRQITDAIDALGNTTAATGKGFAIGSAVLTAVSLLTAFTQKVQMNDVHIADPTVLSGVIVGAMLPYLFAALTMLSVQKAAGAIIFEVRRQFDEIPGLREGSAEADSSKCVEISTTCSVQEMFLPGVYAVFSPLTIGFLVGPRALTGLLGGSIASGMMLALMMANAGGAWDNAKKYIEIGNAHGGKGTTVHKAVVVGDTVGDPFKDTSGPSLNILIKLMSIISLTCAPLMEGRADWEKFYWGFVPLGVMILSTIILYQLYWSKKPAYLEEIADTTKRVSDVEIS